jgi:hypothetical protein
VLDYRFIVSDEDGELRRFTTKADALAFMKDRPKFSLRILPPRKPINVLELVGECPF